ncbi:MULTISPECIES: beta 1-4 rhamnosyltransferase Cps2T [Heyndrickxia]|uniref:beta 1-4 rhamnosyltransferase Cps2T n=1 Tax=Heyndrickxia TaxID=2837504 RepID=UPI000CE2B602|nr:DUF1972 domain-containing protein [Heyndrickxia coagulans]AVD55067.1 glycosyl transferase [Heyndrickxia coagulans]
MKHVFIIGSKGLPANYGGFETFVENLTKKKVNENIFYHISCMSDNNREFNYNNARCFNVKVHNIGSAKAVLYDILSLKRCIEFIRLNKLEDCVVYILACRIGPFMSVYKRQLKKLGVNVFVNPDGHEWKRSKWNSIVKKYWKLSERLMIKNSDLVICDSKGIESYIQKDYYKYNPKTHFIAYGADVEKSNIESDDQSLKNWYEKYNIIPYNYYLIVGRFVPENNYEFVIKEFMNSNTKKDLVIISNVEENDFYLKLLKDTHFNKDKRIKFVGTVYQKELLKKIREQAFAYIHGHEVGGTNPSLLEALASTRINILLDVVFNREVGENGAIYFSKKYNELARLIDKTEKLSHEYINKLNSNAKLRILEEYSWKKIIKQYENLFLNNLTVQESEKQKPIN